MEKDYRSLKIVMSVVLQDAGEATRSLEIAKGIRELCPSEISLEIIFLSHGSKFEEKIINNGFGIYKCEPELKGIGFHADLEPSANNFVGSEELAVKLLKGEIKALEELTPDLVIHGFWPFASLARRMLDKLMPGICFLPVPLEENMFGSFLMKDIPDQIKPLTYLPESFRRALIKSIPKALKLKAPMMRQGNIIKAAKACGLKDIKLKNIFDMLEADLTIVNDLEVFYQGQKIPNNFKIVGPLFSPSEIGVEFDPLIEKVLLGNENELKIFCTMGSSGTKKQLLEAIEAIVSVKDCKWKALILAPPSVCPLSEALDCVGDAEGIYITDKFVPAQRINAMVDLVVCHGGQGTVQTAIASGTPIVGVAMQPEQQINLDNIVLSGAGIRISIHKWQASNIQTAIRTIQNNPAYRKNAEKLQNSLKNIDGRRNSAEAIWEFIADHINIMAN